VNWLVVRVLLVLLVLLGFQRLVGSGWRPEYSQLLLRMSVRLPA
jgi:hypothetical protein